ncbi:unnamed protein product, partial [Schistosoma curassoni]|uniref:HCO3_cotransp domain-containing protein n=1 Tax=Schistosoma curassoni TaxID=6186 RepID=A0A183L2L0_9TREM
LVLPTGRITVCIFVVIVIFRGIIFHTFPTTPNSFINRLKMKT